MKNQESKFLKGLRKVCFACLLMSSFSSAWAQDDPCNRTTPLSGGEEITKRGIGNVGNGYNYELWNDGTPNGAITPFGGKNDCAFKARWEYCGDFLARIGYYDGSCSKKFSDLGDITADYNYKKKGDGGGSYSYIGIYGWTKNPLVEYYIVDDSFTPGGGGMFFGANATATYTLDGDTYTLMIGQRYDAPSIEGEHKNFTQIFAKRNTYRECGHVSVSEHIKKWIEMGVELGGVYDCKLLCEVGGGKGSIEYTHATMTWKGQSGSFSAPAEPEEPQAPYKEAINIPGTVEIEDYDKGGNGFAYYDTDDKNEGGIYRNDGVDIVEGGTGYAVGYTTNKEWLEYTVNVKETGKYVVELNAANGNSDVAVDLYIDDKKIASISGYQTDDGEWSTYQKMTAKTSELTAGEHILKVKFESNYNNVDYVKFYTEADAPVEEEPIVTPNAPGSYFDANGAYFGPECEESNYSGAFYTGNYTSPFQTILGKTEEEIQAKLDELWNHYFKGNDNSKVYYETSNGEAYIYDTGNGDVRSEGMSYGMMICVQTNHKTEFDKLWKWAKNHMWHRDNGMWDGYFAWKRTTSGSGGDANCAPDGEMYFTTALLLAANRWGDNSYMTDAQYILKSMWKNGTGSLFNEQQNIITFQPYNCSTYGDPSYDLPAFLELFYRWSTTNNNKWNACISATRDHLFNSSNSQTGLFTDYNYFDGNPKTDAGDSGNYMYDAMRCAMNFGMDYYLFGKDKQRQEEMARRIINFFEKDGYSHARFTWQGSIVNNDSYTLGETGANAVACYALMGLDNYKEIVAKNLSKAWDANLATGQWRYYDGLVHYLSMLHLCGSFKIWKPAPSIEEKTVTGIGSVTYQGVDYTENATITAFDDCQLYNVTIEVSPAESTDTELAESEDGIVLMPNPATDYFIVKSAKDITKIELINVLGQTVHSQSDETVSVALPKGSYLVKITTIDGKIEIKKLQIR